MAHFSGKKKEEENKTVCFFILTTYFGHLLELGLQNCELWDRAATRVYMVKYIYPLWRVNFEKLD